MRYRVLLMMSCTLAPLAPEEPARIQFFRAEPRTAAAGRPVTLQWSATGADRVRLEPLGLELPPQSWVTLRLPANATFWLHVANAAGGQSTPLVVGLDPAFSAHPLISRNRASLPAPASEEPAAPPRPPATPLPVPRPAPDPAPKRPRPATLPSPAGQVWIQFAALADPRRIAQLGEQLHRTAGIEVVLAPVPDPKMPGRTLQRVLSGPFPRNRAARQRIRELRPRLAPLGIHPIIAGP